MAYYKCEKCDATIHVRPLKPRQRIRRPICFKCYKTLTPTELAYFNEEPVVFEETDEQWEARIKSSLDNSK